MTTQIFKTILAGILAGVALFMVPFVLLKILVFFLLIKAIFRLMGGRRRGHWRYAYAQHYKNMTEEERHAFMQKYDHSCGWNSSEKQRTPSENADRATGA